MLSKRSKILITGGAGFIGSNFIKHILGKYQDYQIINLDKLTYCGNLKNLTDIDDNPRYEFIKGDICDLNIIDKIASKGLDAIINFAAESHVDRSILDPTAFLKTSIQGTHALLEAVKKYQIKKFIQISTDEVYGSIEKGSFNETDPLQPRNPYAATKAGADLLALSFFETYGTPVIITRTTNNFGPFQHPEKFMPKIITFLLMNKKIPIYGNGKNVRDWIFVKDNCAAIDLILNKGKAGEAYNICAKNELTNIEVAEKIIELLGKSRDSLDFVPDRPGHDKRYSLDCSKVKSLGWSCRENFNTGLEKTLKWYKDNEWWWKPLIEKMG